MAIELSPTPVAALIEGPVGSGKTSRLVERAAMLLDGGTRPDDLLVLAATPDAARALAARLANRCGESGRAVTVTCPRRVALDLLGSAKGRAFSGRDGRLVTPMEMGFLMEDMKVSGLKNRRLKEMLKFFYRRWTELAEGTDGDEDWLLPGEEADVHRRLKAVLGFTGGILEPEAAAMAVRFLTADPAALARAQRPHVLVDDYQMLSRASQHLANLLARDSMTVAADPLAVAEVFDSYPYGEGIDEFVQANGACERIELAGGPCCPAATRAAWRLGASLENADDLASAAADASADARQGIGPDDGLSVIATPDPAAECSAVAEAVAAEVAVGTAADDIYVLTFHPAWTRQIVAALDERGIEAEEPGVGRVAVGDYRDLDRCAAARLLVALTLAGDPADALAWRCWCGFGDYLGNSAAFDELRRNAQARGIGLVRALDEMTALVPGDAATGPARIARAYRAGRSLIDACAGLEGDALLRALATGLDGTAPAHVARALKTVRALTRPFPDGEMAGDDAAALSRRAAWRLTAPVFEHGNGRVRVGGGDHLIGFAPACLIVVGFVNGLFPSRDYFDATVTPPDKQRTIRRADTQRLYSLVGKASRRLVISSFATAPLVEAEALRLEIDRVRLRGGERVAFVSPSIYLSQIIPDEEHSV